MSAVRALSLLGSFYGAQGKQEVGFMYFGMHVFTTEDSAVLKVFFPSLGLSNSLSQKSEQTVLFTPPPYH